MEELRRIHSEGNTIIMVTHNPNLTTYATRVIHMLDGGIDEDIKTVSDEDLPVPIHERLENDEYDEEEPFIFRGAEMEADTSLFEERKNLIQHRITDPDELGGVSRIGRIITSRYRVDDDAPALKPIQKPGEKLERPVERPIERPVERPVVKPVEEPAEKVVEKPAEKPEKIQKVNKSAEKTTKTAKKPRKNSSDDIKLVLTKPKPTKKRKTLHYTGDPGFKIKERPSIEDLVEKEDK